MSEAPFAERVQRLPLLGLGVSTEYGAGSGGLDIAALRAAQPEWVAFLEIGIDLARGLDDDARRWIAAGLPTTYHFLDLNLEDPRDADADWLRGTAEIAEEIGAAWLCGDAGRWHLGARDRGHGTLLPPILCEDSALAMAKTLRALRAALAIEVLPENPPAHLYVGDLTLLEYFAVVVETADSGFLLDAAHLAIYQRLCGRDPVEGLEHFPLERVVEIHVAGGTAFEHEGRVFVDDDHSPEPLEETWAILDYVLPRTPALRALVYECERNPPAAVEHNFERLADRLAVHGSALGRLSR